MGVKRWATRYTVESHPALVLRGIRFGFGGAKRRRPVSGGTHAAKAKKGRLYSLTFIRLCFTCPTRYGDPRIFICQMVAVHKS